jgi:hypothetical protein
LNFFQKIKTSFYAFALHFFFAPIRTHLRCEGADAKKNEALGFVHPKKRKQFSFEMNCFFKEKIFFAYLCISQKCLKTIFEKNSKLYYELKTNFSFHFFFFFTVFTVQKEKKFKKVMHKFLKFLLNRLKTFFCFPRIKAGNQKKIFFCFTRNFHIYVLRILFFLTIQRSSIYSKI